MTLVDMIPRHRHTATAIWDVLPPDARIIFLCYRLTMIIARDNEARAAMITREKLPRMLSE